MAEPQKTAQPVSHPPDTVRRKVAEPLRGVPTETETHGMERGPGPVPLHDAIRAHTNRPHKGDVGRPGTNEEVFQGSKEKELR